MMAAKLGVAAIAVIALHLGRTEAALQRRGSHLLPRACVCSRRARDRLRGAFIIAGDLAHAVTVAVGLASLAGTAVAAVVLALQ